MTTAEDIIEALQALANEDKRCVLMRFFKTGPGQYGEGDRFLGATVPQTRSVVRNARHDTPLEEIERLLASEWHEARLCGLLLLVERMRAALPSRRRPAEDGAAMRKELTDFYLAHTAGINNWDLVDLSAPYILGNFLLHPLPGGAMPDDGILRRLCDSESMWEQRISIVSTAMLIRHDRFDETLYLAERLLSHKHDLIHKAVGWMLRETGKRDMDTLRGFLDRHVHEMPRTALRYAIERMSPHERTAYMRR